MCWSVDSIPKQLTYCRLLQPLSGWWFQPPPRKNDGVKVSWDDEISIYGKIKHVTNHQPAIFDDFPLLVGYIPNWCSLVYLSWLHLHFPCFSELPHFLRLPRGGLNLGVLDISDWVGYPYC